MKFCVQFPVISYSAKKKGGGLGQQNALPLYPLQIETKTEKSVVLSQTSVPGVARMSPGRVSLLYGQPQPEYTCQSKNTKDRSQGYFICQVFLGCCSPGDLRFPTLRSHVQPMQALHHRATGVCPPSHASACHGPA